MSNDDELDRLLREVDASLSPSGATPAPVSKSTGGQVARVEAEPRGRTAAAVRTGTVAGVVCGAGVFVATFFLQVLPVIDNPLNSGLGAFVGAFLTGSVLSFRSRKG